MAFVHGKNTVVKVATDDISAYVTSSDITLESDEHDLATYGKSGHVPRGGLIGVKFSLQGKYDSTSSTGPRAKLEPLVGTSVAVVRQPEGAGTGKPQDSFTGLLKTYVETNPVADFITWSAEISGEFDTLSTTAQS